MDNGHEKLIAKVQHFYDLLIKKAEQYDELALTAEQAHDRQLHGIYAAEYHLISTVYKDIFEDFLYNNDTACNK